MDNEPLLDAYQQGEELSANDSEISEAYYERYKRRQEGLSLIRQTIELLSLIQQHRASSLAVLGGTEHFRQRTYTLQRSIHEKVGELHDSSPLLDRQRWRAILTEWFTIKGHWHKDDPLDNFELHNYLIDQMTLLVWEIAKRSELMIDSTRGFLLSEFAFKHLIKHIEAMGMLRGLSTYIASRGESPRSYKMRLSHLRQVCEDSFNRHQQTLVQLPGAIKEELETQYPAQENLRLTKQYLNLISGYMLNLEEVKVDSDEVFYHATRAIEAELKLLEKVMGMLEANIEDERLSAAAV